MSGQRTVEGAKDRRGGKGPLRGQRAVKGAEGVKAVGGAKDHRGQRAGKAVEGRIVNFHSSKDLHSFMVILHASRVRSMALGTVS